MARHSPHSMPIPSAPQIDKAPRSTAWPLLRSLRPEQWTKNLILFGGLLFGMRLFDVDAVLRATAAFFIFCGLSGVVYLVNDIMDREADKRHPLKRHRPIASGALSPGTAKLAAGLIGAAGLGGSWMLGRPFFYVAVAYLSLQTFYSGPLKHMVIIDVLTIAFGFVLRAVGGAVVIFVPISHWLMLVTVLLALFLALSKRRHELTLLAEGATSHRRILEEYSPYLLDQMISVVTASTLMAYALYTVAPETVAKFGTDKLALTIPFPLYGIFRYLYLVHQKKGGGSPSTMLLTDKPLLVCVGLWVCAVVLIIYRPLMP
jgi:4-hydroxybenzoate polyprenyltransferase